MVRGIPRQAAIAPEKTFAISLKQAPPKFVIFTPVICLVARRGAIATPGPPNGAALTFIKLLPAATVQRIGHGGIAI